MRQAALGHQHMTVAFRLTAHKSSFLNHEPRETEREGERSIYTRTASASTGSTFAIHGPACPSTCPPRTASYGRRVTSCRDGDKDVAM